MPAAELSLLVRSNGMQTAEVGHSHTQAPTFASSNAEGLRALRIGIAGLEITTAVQAALLVFSGSVALLGDTLHNGVDVLGTVIVWIAFLYTGRARTDRFSFGFHRVEDLAGLVVVTLIALSAGLVLFESFRAFGNDVDVDRPWFVFFAGLVGFVGNESVAQFKIRTGDRIGSSALKADGLHSRADGLTSIGVVAAAIGLLAGLEWLDATVGLVIGLVILWTAWSSGRDVILRLLDVADPVLRERLSQEALQVAGIDHVNDLRFRQIGRTVHVVANVCIAAETTLADAHEMAEGLRHGWLLSLPPGSIVDIHVDPYTPGQGPLHDEELGHAHEPPDQEPEAQPSFTQE